MVPMNTLREAGGFTFGMTRGLSLKNVLARSPHTTLTDLFHYSDAPCSSFKKKKSVHGSH